MNPLSSEQAVAAAQLKRICDMLNADMVVIGAMAYLTWIQDPHRHTLDIDVAVTVDLDDYHRLAAMLRTSGWEQEAKREHRWITPEGVRMDIVPAGPVLRARGVLDWPVSGVRMSLVGFEHVFKDSVSRPFADGLNLKVIPLPVLVLLKIVAYLDNPAQRQKDIQDLAAMIKRFDPDDDRRFGNDVLDAGLEYETTGAYLVGKDLAPLCSPDERQLVTASSLCSAIQTLGRHKSFGAPFKVNSMRRDLWRTRSSTLLL
jgi:predicted nucleotidyltransferase